MDACHRLRSAECVDDTSMRQQTLSALLHLLNFSYYYTLRFGKSHSRLPGPHTTQDTLLPLKNRFFSVSATNHTHTQLSERVMDSDLKKTIYFHLVTRENVLRTNIFY